MLREFPRKKTAQTNRENRSAEFAGQLDPKSTAFAGTGIDADAPAHPFDALLHDGEADARTRITLLNVQTLEQMKNASVMFGRNANAVVAEAETHRSAIALRGNRHLRRPAR